MPLKELLNAFHDAVKFVLHVILIPVVAALKAIDAGIVHLVTELGKV